MLNRLRRNPSMIVLLLLVMALSFAVGYSAAPQSVTAQDTFLENERLFIEIYDRVSPSIVSINIANSVIQDISGGSGFVYDNQGHIITNYHVVDDAQINNDRIEVSFIDGTIVRASVIGSDPDSDLAVLKVDVPQEHLQPVTFSDSDFAAIGQQALAIGSPFGQNWTMTAGIISALDRTIDGLGDYQIGAVIQTDAAINPGNSGGPLLNLRGEVIGVNSQIVSRDRVNSGVAFAVPGNLVRRVVDELLRQGFVDYAFMGVSVADVDLGEMERLNLPNDTRGVTIRVVEGPAAAGGLRQNDVITAIDGEPIPNFGSLIAFLSGRTRPNETITVTVLRNGQLQNFNVTLSSRR